MISQKVIKESVNAVRAGARFILKKGYIYNQDGIPCKDYTGTRSGKLVAVEPCEAPNDKRNNRNQYWSVVCDCGKGHVIQGRMLKRGNIIQCPACRD